MNLLRASTLFNTEFTLLPFAFHKIQYGVQYNFPNSSKNFETESIITSLRLT